MIVYFSGSTRTLPQEINTYRRILKQIRALGHTVTTDWVEAHLERIQDGHKNWNLEDIVPHALGSIENSEVLIAEVTSASAFGVGYEVAHAVQHKKPVLMLAKEELVWDTYGLGIKDELITFKPYNDKNLEDIVADFLDENTVNTKDLRFNFVIDRKIHNHLRWRAYKSGKTKAEVVRDLLLRDMENQD